MPEYLPRSATFIHTLLRFQRRYRPVILARHLTNLGEFPLNAPVIGLDWQANRNPLTRRLVESVPWFGKAYARGVTKEAARHGCVLLHGHFGWSCDESIFAARQLRLPVVTTFYGRDLADRKRRWERREVYDDLFAEGTLFICEGPAMADQLKRLGCAPGKIRVVRIGIDLAHFPFRVPVREGPLVLLQVARLVEKKGVDLTLRAFAAARERIGDSELWIVGDGPLRMELELLAETLGIERSVKFLGEMSFAGYRSLLDRVHIGIQPSRTAADGDTEGGAPTVLLELQARGIPVVATRHADIPFVVEVEDCLAEENDVEGLAERLVWLATLGEVEWRDHSQQRRRRVEEQHDAAAIAKAVEAIYAEAQEGCAAA
jgi:glycosyltransferase involved in cell wall biosynthesis